MLKYTVLILGILVLCISSAHADTSARYFVNDSFDTAHTTNPAQPIFVITNNPVANDKVYSFYNLDTHANYLMGCGQSACDTTFAETITAPTTNNAFFYGADSGIALRSRTDASRVMTLTIGGDSDDIAIDVGETLILSIFPYLNTKTTSFRTVFYGYMGKESIAPFDTAPTYNSSNDNPSVFDTGMGFNFLNDAIEMVEYTGSGGKATRASKTSTLLDNDAFGNDHTNVDRVTLRMVLQSKESDTQEFDWLLTVYYTDSAEVDTLQATFDIPRLYYTYAGLMVFQTPPNFYNSIEDIAFYLEDTGVAAPAEAASTPNNAFKTSTKISVWNARGIY